MGIKTEKKNREALKIKIHLLLGGKKARLIERFATEWRGFFIMKSHWRIHERGIGVPITGRFSFAVYYRQGRKCGGIDRGRQAGRCRVRQRDAGFLTAWNDESSDFVRNWWLRAKPSLPPGSHEHFTRQTIVYRIDLFPTPPLPPLPPPSPFLLPASTLPCLFTSTSKCHSAQPTTNLLLLVFPSCLSMNSTCFCVSWTPRLPSSVRNSCELLSKLRDSYFHAGRTFAKFINTKRTNNDCIRIVNCIFMKSIQFAFPLKTYWPDEKYNLFRAYMYKLSSNNNRVESNLKYKYIYRYK